MWDHSPEKLLRQRIYARVLQRTSIVVLASDLNGNQATVLEHSMFRLMAKYTMSPDSMVKWLDQLPALMKASAEIDEDIIFEDSWVSKDRTQWLHIRTLESPEANRRYIDKMLASEWGKKYASLMDDHEHTTWELELIVPT